MIRFWKIGVTNSKFIGKTFRAFLKLQFNFLKIFKMTTLFFSNCIFIIFTYKYNIYIFKKNIVFLVPTFLFYFLKSKGKIMLYFFKKSFKYHYKKWYLHSMFLTIHYPPIFTKPYFINKHYKKLTVLQKKKKTICNIHLCY